MPSDDWVSASRTRSYAIGDPVLDWLNLYGADQGFTPDDQQEGFDSRTDFTAFIFEQGHRFETGVVRLLSERSELATLSRGHSDVRDLSVAESTFKAMKEGVPVIYQGVLWDAEHQTLGCPDLLIRSDVLGELFPDSLTPEQAAVGAPDLGGRAHYCVVDIKFSTLRLKTDGELGSVGSAKAYKLQQYTYTTALGRLQGYEPPYSFVLGRGWEQTVSRETTRGFSCFDRLGPIPQNGMLSRTESIAEVQRRALAWLRRVRTKGHEWNVLPSPSVPDLYPNMTNQQDGPWHFAKKSIAGQLGELTTLWQVGQRGREKAHNLGVRSWHESDCTPEAVGVTGKARGPTLQAILDVNREENGPPVKPARIRSAEEHWREPGRLEFFVDFETVNDLADDMSQLPLRGGQPMIFMIGCGHLEKGAWEFASFVVSDLTEPEEARIINGWLAHMAAVKTRLDPSGPEPLLFHWSPAELTNFDTAYNSAKKRHNAGWPSPAWFDFLRQVMWAEPVVVRGAAAFGLKAIAKAMYRHDLIETSWGDGPTDGLGAMVAAWWCRNEAERLRCPMHELELMKEVASYNEVDCRVMAEAIRYLRLNH